MGGFAGLIAAVVLLVPCPVAYAATGELDPSFGGDGFVETRFPAGAGATSVVLQPNGKILVGGLAYRNAEDLEASYALVRYRPNGKRDRSFSRDGKVITTFEDAYDLRSEISIDDLAIRPNGRIVAIGSVTVSATLIEYRKDGSRVKSFQATRPYMGAASGALQPDGSIVAAGYYLPQSLGPYSFALGRFLPDGGRDPSFGSDGLVLTPFGPSLFSGQNSNAADLVIQPDGDIVAVGRAELALSDNRSGFGLAAYNPDGSLDSSFSGDGKLITTFEDGSSTAATAAVLQPNGRTLVVGGFEDSFRGGFTLARYDSAGSLDGSFSGDGKQLTFIQDGAEAQAVMLEPDGRIVVAGSSHNATTGQTNFALARYNPDGSLDPTFSDDGIAVSSFGNANYFAESAVLQPNGRIVVVGRARAGDHSTKFIVARFR